VCAHGGDERARPRRQMDAPRDHVLDGFGRQALEQRHAFAQRRLEGDLAAHRALGDGRDMRLQAHKIGQFVDAFLADHGRIHVGKEKLLAPMHQWLNDDVDRLAGRLPQPAGEALLVQTALRAKGDVGGGRLGEPNRRVGVGHCRKHAFQRVFVERAGRSDQGCDMSHAGHKAVLIAGPTASGKSALALELAERTGGIVVNADSMQVYRDLRVITARPSAGDEARVPHRLYGHVDAGVNYSTGQWLRDLAAVLEEAKRQDRVPILVGGTGLYFKALTVGLAAVPQVAADIRQRVRARMQAEGVAALYAELLARDTVTAHRLMPNDRSRIGRALEVLDATGRSLTDWHREGLPPLIDPAQTARVFLTCERKELVARIEGRFPAMKAHGVPWLIRHLRGEISLDEAAAGAIMDTRRYAKRQNTWFRNQMKD